MISFKIRKDVKADSIWAETNQILPYMRSTAPPPNLIAGTGGGLAYDTVTDRPYYNNGSMWLPIGSGVGSLVSGFSLIKAAEQIIPTGVSTIVVLWSVPVPPYYDDTGAWVVATGVYTATSVQSFTITVNLSWKAGISNLGDRTLKIIYKPSAGAPQTVKQATTQADPDTSVVTTQEATTSVTMAIGDQVWVEVIHDAGLNLTVATGIDTTLSGFIAEVA